MREVVDQAMRWLGNGVGFGRATAVRVVQPSPFRAGRTLLAADGGRLAGAVSAGCVEAAAAEAVLAARRGGYREVVGVDETASVAVLTHDAKFDDAAIAVALRRRARYVGALGSRRTHAARLSRLLESGIDEADLARIHGPIGLDLGGDTPVEIALAILAETIAERHHAGTGAAGGGRGESHG